MKPNAKNISIAENRRSKKMERMRGINWIPNQKPRMGGVRLRRKELAKWKNESGKQPPPVESDDRER